ncbi:MAG: hypothetical protein ACRD8U_03860, partial [Pyrinomonadaceae bacterium]
IKAEPRISCFYFIRSVVIRVVPRPDYLQCPDSFPSSSDARVFWLPYPKLCYIAAYDDVVAR